jgi:hypothetical protein
MMSDMEDHEADSGTGTIKKLFNYRNMTNKRKILVLGTEGSYAGLHQEQLVSSCGWSLETTCSGVNCVEME